MPDELNGWSPRGPVTELSEADCWSLLGANNFGRLGLIDGDRPDIFPIYYQADDATIVFRTGSGTKSRELLENSSVVLEIDEVADHGSWSVVLRGTAEVLTTADEIEAADLLALPDWIPVTTYAYVRIRPSAVRGRRFLRHVHVGR